MVKEASPFALIRGVFLWKPERGCSRKERTVKNVSYSLSYSINSKGVLKTNCLH